MAAPSLISLLADGAWHRGPALAQALGVSRAAVSSRVGELRGLGLAVHAVAGRGYRLAAPLDLLDEAEIRSALGPGAARLDELMVLERTDSTNAELARRGGEGMRACLAEYQSAGRGRAQRPWASPFGANLYVSLGCDLTGQRAPLGALSLAVGVCVVEALAARGAQSLALKWPNDIWAGAQKLGGILIEHRGEIGGRARLIVGVGLNVTMQRDQAQAVDQPWTRLADHMATLPGRNVLAAAVVAALMEAVTGFEQTGFDAFRDRWARFDAVRDQPVRIIECDGERIGFARGIAEDGALRVEINGQTRSVYSGDVSLRLAP
ncbi:biotin--[acetyl-CoA-carboxylase] ligase [Salinisphaera sp.]|uniref:biotin--[acetyl-CoA-carboxylase] ligase n=1 Tax=Salinisphaera sp. TaxID=1914330 RepID=UPI000C674419|nr:biotin--[acetyl-CoA-carboxylase] ligase [Salinisphaera sp.]MAS09530.1 biotin--[acetyl-CoA-carboxylase] ligase [Salinisphaera sp.]